MQIVQARDAPNLLDLKASINTDAPITFAPQLALVSVVSPCALTIGNVNEKNVN